VIACALKAELAVILRLGAFKSGWHKSGTGPHAVIFRTGGIHGVDVALVVSGIGEERAYAAAKRATAAFRPDAFISAGFSCGLEEGLKAGDVVAGQSTASPVRGRAAVYRSAPELLNAATGDMHGAESAPGELVTVPMTLVTSQDKLDVAAEGGWIAADMESAGSARAAYEDGIPFIAIRAITDPLRTDLPVDFNRFIRHGRLDYPRFFLHVITHPLAIPPLMVLGRNSTLAARNLASAIDTVLSRL
jgi:adenosylhomocysteine nucleosidase